ncbi:MAG: type VI secretion system tube protein Hcp [Methanomicrobiales archaeon]|jgi:type VI secretion system secreted protein Hcp|nr:hemolysin-coregulated protein [Methanomicrobiales archaeon]MDD1638886.1 type VI secretion system tube protein Hcp [Methanomicrobiales archaeon]MDD1644826.1 type VI secretion system tube protein Hcp [Methanomicrobiales archaeon]MDD1647035.1 type VI secretion system tube protein Hcp [Methanomicrobiales archaeon]MDD1647700.1 type VI secretion system tube protein Hcp [Methanomicrobiales archaeon]
MVQKGTQFRTGCLLLVILAMGMVVPVAAATNQIGYFYLPSITEKCSTSIGRENLDKCPIYGMVQEVASSTITPGGGGRSTFAFRLTKPVDKATPLLMQAVPSGKLYPKVTITLGATGTSNAFFVTLEDVQITGVKQFTNPDAGSPYGVLEEVTFSYGKIRWSYYRTSTGWDILANRPTLAAAEGEAESAA